MARKWRRPTVDSQFHIDMTWWRDNDRDIRVYLRELLCDECAPDYTGGNAQKEIDWVDEQTGEVKRVDGLWHASRTCCGLKADYISPSTPVIDAVFRTFVANGNAPLTVNELYEILDRRPPATLLRILTANRVYMGIKPIL